jgi:hypothetical protein
VQIPLDYYRILGLPIQVTDEQMAQAYQDRCVQLPHREYSLYAITGRKQLLTQAYDILRDSETRKEYNSNFFSSSHSAASLTENRESEVKLETKEETYRSEEPSLEPYTPTIEVEDNLIVGVLVILQELGEYELVLKIAQPYLDGHKTLQDIAKTTDELQLSWQDLILTIVLTYIELGREQWQQGEYDLAGISQEKGYNLLQEDKVFLDLQQDLKTELNKLRPYRILELLEEPETKTAERKKGLMLLEQMLDDRQGIEGKKSDNSGLDLDDFLRFIQQIRLYLTVKEQQELFEKEANRPSLAASYLAVYALIARGFVERNPELIVRAKNILISLTNRQDVFLEQAICALLLGQTDEADFALAQSREEEIIAFIKEHSQGSSDLLPGLCLYTEKWLQTEVFSQFRDLNEQSNSLKEYFANSKVQNYLEQLSFTDQEEQYTNFSEEVNRMNWEENKEQEGEEFLTESDYDPWQSQSSYDQEEWKSNLELDQDESDNFPLSSLPKLEQETDTESYSDSNVLTVAKRDTEQPLNSDLISFSNFLTSSNPPAPSSENTHQKFSTWKSKLDAKIREKRSHKHVSDRLGNQTIITFVILILLGIFLFIVYNFISNKKPELLNLKISEPPVDILLESPNDNLDNLGEEKNLDNEIALQIVEKWLNAKSKATGPDYEIDQLNQILANPLLDTWRSRAVSLQKENAYRRYEHSAVIESVKLNPNNSNQAIIIAQVKENAKYYQNGRLSTPQSYQENLQVQYDLIKQDNRWLIKDIKVLK